MIHFNSQPNIKKFPIHKLRYAYIIFVTLAIPTYLLFYQNSSSSVIQFQVESKKKSKDLKPWIDSYAFHKYFTII